jgi:signal peptidase I
MTDTGTIIGFLLSRIVAPKAEEPQSPPPAPAPTRNILTGNNMKGLAIEMVKTFGVILAVFLAVNMFSQRIRVTGESMLPNFQDGEIGLVNKSAYNKDPIPRGDVIVFIRPATMTEPSKELIKRVIGLPGETIEIKDDGIVYVNGKALSEPYVKQEPLIGTGSWTIGKDEIFVMGDNRNGSQDSRHWGNLNISNVIGKVDVIYWPLKAIRAVPGWDYSTGKSK